MPYSPQVSNRKPSKQSNNQPTWGACSTIQITNKTVSQNSRCYQHTGILRTSSTCPNMQPKSGFVSKAAKQGKLTIPLYKTPEQSPSLKQKRVPMSSLCTPCCMQYKLKNTYWQACRCSGNEQVSVVLQEPFDKSSSQTKAALAKRQIDKEDPNCKTRSIAQNTQNCLCFICLFRFVCFVSFKIEIPHDCIPHSCNMTASKYWNVPITDCTHSNRTFHHFATTHTAEPRDLKYTNLQLTHASVSIRTFTNWLIDCGGATAIQRRMPSSIAQKSKTN